MENFLLPLFLLNTLMVLLDASLGYHLVPHLLAGVDDPEAADAGVRTTRRLLPFIVALYMFFNCLGYFQARTPILLAVAALLLLDLALQLLLRRKRGGGEDEGDEEE